VTLITPVVPETRHAPDPSPANPPRQSACSKHGTNRSNTASVGRTVEYGALDSDYVFVNLRAPPYGHPLAYPAVYDLVARLRKITGIAFSPHLFRHTYATWLQIGSHAPLRGSAVADENWVPPAAGGLRAVGRPGFPAPGLVTAAAGRCILVVRAVRRGRPPVDRSWPLNSGDDSTAFTLAVDMRAPLHLGLGTSLKDCRCR